MQGVLEVKRAGNELDTRPGLERTARKNRRDILPLNSRPKRLSTEQVRLVEENIDFAMAIARKQARRYPGMESDLEAAAFLGLCEAAIKYEESRNICFLNHAWKRIFGACLDLVRDETPRSFRRSQRGDKQPPVIHPLNPRLTSEDDPVGWEEESIDWVYGQTRRLTGHARQAIRLYYAHGLTMQEIAARLGVAESRVSQLHSQSLSFLREALAS